MKKKILILIPILIISLVIIITTGIIFINKGENTFNLENKYYGRSDMKEINIDELEKIIKDKETFALYIDNETSNFETILKSFQKENLIYLYKIKYNEIQNTLVKNDIKKSTLFVIFHKGEIVDSINDNTINKDEFSKWFKKYINIQKNISYEEQQNINNNITLNNENDTNINLENIIKEDGKVNIYLFWGDGCPHCEAEKEYLESIKEEYGSYYNLYMFETWHNEENASLAKIFAEANEDEIKGVPYTIIGTKSFTGFGYSYYDSFKEAIMSERMNTYDIYFDKIKKY